MLEKMLELIRTQGFCALATADATGTPHCSLMSYAWADQGRVLWLLTPAATRKFANLADNPAVSILIDTRAAPAAGDPVAALTIGGRARVVPAGPERARALAALLSRHPGLEPIAARPDAQVVAVAARDLQLLEGPSQAHHVRLD